MPPPTSWPRISPKQSTAILKLAVSTQVAGISIVTVGVILMVVGAIGLIVGLWVIRSGRAALEI